MKNPIQYFIPQYKEILDRKIWISSDFHGFHKNICYGVSSWKDKSLCRMFSNEVEMTEALCSNINTLVDQEDVLIHLGDWSFGGKDNVKKLRDMINCDRVINLYGNHDLHIRQNSSLQSLFFWTGDYLELKYNGSIVVMCHYPIISWNYLGLSSVCYHGHCHGNLPEPPGRQFDVGVDCWDFKPLLLDDAIERALAKPIIALDHHTDKINYG